MDNTDRNIGQDPGRYVRGIVSISVPGQKAYMNPTIQVTPNGSDTGLVVAGQTITAKTGIGIVGGAVLGHMLLKKHGVMGAIVGAIGGFFIGKKLETPTPPTA